MRLRNLILHSFLFTLPLLINGQTSDKYVTIENKKQFYELKGTGEPVIVFLTGAGVPMSDVSWFTDSLSHISRTLCYDRAGIGQSEFLTSNRSLPRLTTELTEILDQLNVKQPVVLVAHSRGALLARYFTQLHPQHVAGLLLLDPSLPEWRSMRRALRNDAEKVKFDSLYKSFITDTVTYPLIVRQEMFPNPSDSNLLAELPLPRNIPITIIASSKPTEDKYGKQDIDLKKQILKKLIRKRSNVRLVYTEKSGHFIYEDEPRLVLRELRFMFYLNKMLPGHKAWGIGIGF